MSRPDASPLLVAAAASQPLAAELADAGADAVVAYHSSVYRSRGIASVAGLLPWANANQQTLEMLDAVVAGAGTCPVLATVCANDLLSPVDEMLENLHARGARGVLNAPTVGLFTGPVRTALEDSGLGSQTEIDLITRAHEHRLQAWCYVFDQDWTRRAIDVGADVIVIHLGITGDGDATTQLQIAESCFDAIHDAGVDSTVVLHGGSLREPSDFTGMLDMLGGSATFGDVGFFGASAFECSSLGVGAGQAMLLWRTELRNWRTRVNTRQEDQYHDA